MSGRACLLLVAFGLVAPGAAAQITPSREAAVRREPLEAQLRERTGTAIRVLVPQEDAEISIDGVAVPGSGVIRQIVHRTTRAVVQITVTWRPNTYTTMSRSSALSIGGQPSVVADLTTVTPADRAEVRYVPTPSYVVQEMIELAGIRAGDVVFEPGCGDARVTIAAVKAGARRGIGIDFDPARVKESLENVRASGLERRIEIRLGDALRIPDLSDATVVFLYMGDEFNSLLKPLLLQQLRPGARIVSHRFLMGEWQPDKTVSLPDEAGTTDVHLWTIPAAGVAPSLRKPG